MSRGTGRCCFVGISDGIASGQQGGKVHLTVKGLVNELYLDDLRNKTH